MALVSREDERGGGRARAERGGLIRIGRGSKRGDEWVAGAVKEAGRRIRRHLDTEAVIAAAIDEVRRVARSATVSFWLTRGNGHPVLALSNRRISEPAPSAAVVTCARRGRVVRGTSGETAIPVLAPQSGLLAVLFVEGAKDGAPVEKFLEELGRETGQALETANLYEQAVTEKEKSEAILARVGDAVVVTDQRGGIVQWNPAAEQIFGCRAEVALGRGCREVLGLRIGETELHCEGGCALLLAHPDVTSVLGIETWRFRSDSRRQPLLAHVSMVRDQDGNVSEVVHSLRDITRLKEADEAKTLFLATASHELKTPLTVIQGFAQTLSGDYDWDDEERAEALQAISRRAVQLNKIVDRLLLSSRIEAGKVEVILEDVQLEPIVSERVEALRIATARVIRSEPEPGLPPARADVDAVTTVLDHLLDNAVKYSPGGDPIVVATTSDGIFVRLSVHDGGIGLDADQQAHCFDKFWQAESTDVRRFGGTGIGLYIVRSLVEAMNGQVTVKSGPGEGSTFTATLLAAGAEPPREAEAKPVPKALVGERSITREFMRQIGIPGRRRR